jgi:hypothetical protein
MKVTTVRAMIMRRLVDAIQDAEDGLRREASA